jgi:hypothetical protein
MTPLLRWGRGLLKLELLGPAGSVAGRVRWPERVALSGNQALAAAEAARGKIALGLRGPITHEIRETLRIWGAIIMPEAPPPPDMSAEFRRTLGAELAGELREEPALLVGPAGESAALRGALEALRERWPRLRGVALVAADGELPDLPEHAEHPQLPENVDIVAVTRGQAAEARSRVARELGLLASHAGAAAAVHARDHGGVALVTSTGEREFSLEGPR